MFPLGGSDARALRVTEMADRTTRVLATALSLGTVVPTAERSAVRIDTRDDEQTDAARPDSRGGP